MKWGFLHKARRVVFSPWPRPMLEGKGERLLMHCRNIKSPLGLHGREAAIEKKCPRDGAEEDAEKDKWAGSTPSRS